VLLLDEIEKAHPDVFNILLQIMEDGRLTDSMGRTVNFENTLLIMTSNAGTGFKAGSIGFNQEGYDVLKERVDKAVKETFRPEFLNRVDEIVVFERLTRDQLRQIADIMLREVEKDVRDKGMHITFSDEVKEFLIDKGFDPKYGARPLRKTIQRHIEDEMAEMFLAGRIGEGSGIEVSMDGNKVRFSVSSLPEKA